MSGPNQKPASSWINLAVDFGPLLVFFVAYRHFTPKDSAGIGAVVGVTKGTIAFMVATVIALIVSKWRLGRISPMLWLSSALIIGFGALTVFLGDPFWIQVKPTVIYLVFGMVLLGGWMRGRPVLRYLLQSAFDGLSDIGWLKLSRNWGLFFIALAVINEVLANRDWFTFEQWLKAKLWLFLPLSFAFTFAHMPMLLRHGLAAEEKDEAEAITPHE